MKKGQETNYSRERILQDGDRICTRFLMALIGILRLTECRMGFFHQFRD